ncbi:MAG TPA: DUF1707 domain-containing protein [Chloroflexota bacterium]
MKLVEKPGTTPYLSVGDTVPLLVDRKSGKAKWDVKKFEAAKEHQTAAENAAFDATLSGAEPVGSFAPPSIPTQLRENQANRDAVPGEASGGGLRISDSDRDLIAAVLDQHAAEGRLTMDELDQRVGVLYGAQTRAQAVAVLADLPALTAAAAHRFHPGDEHDTSVPPLPEWLDSNRVVEFAPPEPGAAPAAAVPSTAAPIPAHEDRSATRKRAKLRQDENAVGHTFQATRRAINAELESARASGKPDEVQRLNDRLRQAQVIAESARQAVAAGDRATVQRLLAQLRTLG